jgi:DNA-binding response OmpR family regulator
MVAFRPEEAEPLAERLRAAGVPVGRVQSWGTQAYRQILARREPIVLDTAGEPGTAELHRSIRALRHLGPVIALASGPHDLADGLAEGAVNVLDRELPVEQLAARVLADLRWLARRPEPTPQARQVPSAAPVLLHILARSRGSICCHELCWLLGSPQRPLARGALRARLQRLEPALHAHGLDVRRDSGWGSSVYTVTALD